MYFSNIILWNINEITSNFTFFIPCYTNLFLYQVGSIRVTQIFFTKTWFNSTQYRIIELNSWSLSPLWCARNEVSMLLRF